MFKQFTKSYNTISGNLKIVIDYWIPDESDILLSFDVVDEVELNYGYEDEDQLTFYPNVCKLTFDDYDEINSDILKRSLEQYSNTLPESHLQYSGVTIFLDENIKFKGYIDEESFSYDDRTMRVSFEVLDLTMALGNMNVDRDKIIDIFGVRIPDNNIITLTYPLYGIFKQVWSDFSGGLWSTNDINNPGISGTFINHNWQFTGRKISTSEFKVRDWANVSEFATTLFNFDSMGLFGENRPCKTWTDFLRIMAISFGAIIGVADYGKVYFRKRFTSMDDATFMDITSSVEQYPLIKVFLKALRGVVVRNHWNGERTFQWGDIERTSNDEVKYEDRVTTIDTYVGSYNDETGSGTCIYIDGADFPVMNEVKDPELPSYAAHCWQIVGIWLRNARLKLKRKIECTLTGINYDMVTVYKYNPLGNPFRKINFRPMTMKQKLIKHKTDIVGIEI